MRLTRHMTTYLLIIAGTTLSTTESNAGLFDKVKKAAVAALEPARDGEPRPPIINFPAGADKVLSRDCKVTSSDSFGPLQGELEYITDGNKEHDTHTHVQLHAGTQWVQIDLGAEHEISAVWVWHYNYPGYQDAASVYYDVICQISNDPEFIAEVVTVFNNDHDNSSKLGQGKDKEYAEDHYGRPFVVGGVKGRYVRLYSRGNSSNEANGYNEIEVYGTINMQYIKKRQQAEQEKQAEREKEKTEEKGKTERLAQLANDETLGEYKLGITQAQLEGVTLTREDGNPAGDLLAEVAANKKRSYILSPVTTVPFEGHVIKKVMLKFDADIVVGIQMFFAEGEDISGIEKLFIKKYGEASSHDRHEGGMQLSWSKRPVELAVMCGDRSTASYVKLVTDKYSAIAKENFAKISETFKKQNVPDDATFNALKAKGDKHKSETLVFKGFYLGMPIEDAALVVNYYSREKPCQLVRRKDGSSYIGSGTIYVLSDKQGQVTKFKFCKEILHKMFDSERMPHQEFLQTFIKAYDVPSLSPVIVEWKPLGQIVGSQTVYTHQSDKGYYLKFFDAKEIYDREGALSANLAGYGIRKYGGDDDGVMLLETATERQSAFD